MPRIKATTCYISTLHGRLFFAYTLDPVSYKSWLQSKVRTELRIVDVYVGDLRAKLKEQFSAQIRPDSGFESNRALQDFLSEQPRAKFTGETRRKWQRLRTKPWRYVSRLAVLSLPIRVTTVALARLLRADYRTVRAWISMGLPTQTLGRYTFVERDELLNWLDTHGRLLK